jgi:hypothetical protein
MVYGQVCNFALLGHHDVIVHPWVSKFIMYKLTLILAKIYYQSLTKKLQMHMLT